jgi:hypothetical protein
LAAEQLSNSFPVILALDSINLNFPTKIKVTSGISSGLFLDAKVTSRSSGTRPLWAVAAGNAPLRLLIPQNERVVKTGNEHVIREVFRINTETVLKSVSEKNIPRLINVELHPKKLRQFYENALNGPNLRLLHQRS